MLDVTRKRKRYLFFCLCLFASPGAGADVSRDTHACFTSSPFPQIDIGTCTVAIRDGNHVGQSLATLYAKRGFARYRVQQYAQAIEDYNLAIQHNPHAASALMGRGQSQRLRGNVELALADFDAALGLNPFFAEAYRERGIAYFFGRAPDQAAADFRAALRIRNADAESWTLLGLCHLLAGAMVEASANFAEAHAKRFAYEYLPLWRYLALAGKGEAEEILRVALARLGDQEWPRPLLEYYLSRTSIDRVLEGVADAARHSAAAYFIGAASALRGDREQSRVFFQRAVANTGVTIVERVMAQHALASGPIASTAK